MTFGEGMREGRARLEVNALKGPGFVIGSRLGTDSTVLAGRLLFSV